jgi:hypothetical protein
MSFPRLCGHDTWRDLFAGVSCGLMALVFFSSRHGYDEPPDLTPSPRGHHLRLASVTLQRSVAYDHGLAIAEVSKLFKPYEARRDQFGGASLASKKFRGPAMEPGQIAHIDGAENESLNRKACGRSY